MRDRFFGSRFLAPLLAVIAVTASAIGQANITLRMTPPPKEFAREVAAFSSDWPELHSKTGKETTLVVNKKFAPEEFSVTVGRTVRIEASTGTGAAWALQSLGDAAESSRTNWSLKTRPDTAFRSVLIDVARRYHSPSTLRQIVRWCAAGRVRYIQLHLTDDQNWMLPTKSLAGVDRFNQNGKPAYTTREIEELQNFAIARGVTLIPEIDVPGHSSLLIRHDKARFGIRESESSNCINFASKTVRGAITELIKETTALFKDSPYIHLGGDEAWYPNAEKDPSFVTEIARLGSGASTHRVFADFVGEMCDTAIKQGKTPIVWEGFEKSEFAKSRIPKSAIVVAWENAYYPAAELLKDGYRIINAGWDPYYVVNHFPYDSFTLVPLPKLLGHDPRTFAIVDFRNGQQPQTDLGRSDQVLGSMMCWWEGHEWNAQTTLPLRIMALGARLWKASGTVDYPKFLQESNRKVSSIQRRTVPFQLTTIGTRRGNDLQFEAQIEVKASSKNSSLKFAYRTDGQIPTLADILPSLKIDKSAVVSVQAFAGNKPVGENEFRRFQRVTVVNNLAMGAKVTASTPEDPQFPLRSVTDGVSSDVASYWLGYANPCQLTVDLGRIQEVNRVDVVPFWAAGSAMHYTVDVSSDGSTWSKIDTTKASPVTQEGQVHRFPTAKLRLIRVSISGSDQYPPSMARIHEVRAFLD